MFLRVLVPLIGLLTFSGQATCGIFDKLEKKVEEGKAKISGGDDKEGRALGPCKAEAEKYCKSVEKDVNKLFSCLKENKDHLTPPCKAAYNSYRKK